MLLRGNVTPEQCDEHIGAEVLFPLDSEHVKGVAKRRVKDFYGNPIGKRDKNPLLDTRSHEVKLPDGSTEECGANLIAESTLASVDDEGRVQVHFRKVRP